MQMKPIRTFLFIVVTFAVLLVVPLLFPNGKISISGFEVRVYKTVFPLKTGSGPVLANSFLSVPTGIGMMESIRTEQASLPDPINRDTLKNRKLQAPETQQNFTATQVDTDIDIPPDQEAQWARLNARFSEAALLDRPLRILYYGDSQIENDRITSVFRKALQERYGGTGRGLVPVESIYNTANNFIMTASGNWEKESVIKTKQKNLDLGLLCEAFKIRHSGTDGDSIASSWVKIRAIKSDVRSSYSILSIFYRAAANSHVSVSLNKNKQIVRELSTGNDVHELRVNLVEIPEDVELNFSTSSEITVYGLNLESPRGIMVDNIALRGCSYPGFTRIDTTRLKQMAELLKPSVVILQYGVNVVPKVTTDYTFYKDDLNRELAYLRAVLPDTPVLLVSVSDMACKMDGELESYPNIEDVLKTQEEVARENNCAFWNLYESMGGKGSMINWVERQPPLGNTDYVHYTSLGAERVGGLFAGKFIKALEFEKATASIINEP